MYYRCYKLIKEFIKKYLAIQTVPSGKTSKDWVVSRSLSKG